MTRDHLDEAIDVVAARLTSVTADDGLALRIANALPAHTAWSLLWLRLAMTGALGIGIALIVLRPFGDRSDYVLVAESAGGPFVEFRAVVERASVELEPAAGRTAVGRPKNARSTTEDFERSLAPIPSPAPLAVVTVKPSDLPGQGALVIEPLAIADLPLAETVSPRD